jgi:hypothetical protein
LLQGRPDLVGASSVAPNTQFIESSDEMTILLPRAEPCPGRALAGNGTDLLDALLAFGNQDAMHIKLQTLVSVDDGC